MMMCKPDSSAFALSIKNFGHMPGELQETWSADFMKTGKSHVPLPKRLIIELLNSCNYDCPMCRVGRYGINYSRKFPLYDFKRVLDELKNGVEEVRLNGLGESTLLPDFRDYIQELVARKIKVELITNGSGRLVDYELLLENNGTVIISWDAASKDKFEILRRPAKWGESVEKLMGISQIAKKYQRLDNLFLMFTLQKMNIEELPVLSAKCREWGIKQLMVNIVKLPDDGLKNEIERIRSSFKLATEVARKNHVRLMLPDQVCGEQIVESPTLQTSSNYCTMPMEEAVLRWNGDVQVCNMFNPYIYGNIRLSPFKTIWNNAYAQVFRKNVNSQSRHPYCQHCVYMRDAYTSRL